MPRPSVVIVSPAPPGANNGNEHTAQRWASFLRGERQVRIVQHWPDALAREDGLMIALHARRSADAVAAWSASAAASRLAVVLTGTDLYRDLDRDATARRSLELAGQLVVLQDKAIDALPAAHRGKARVIFQSTASRAPLAKPDGRLRAVMVGHMRDIKSPQTYFDAAYLLRERGDIELHHIGRAEEEVWAQRARQTQADCPSYTWLGPMDHDATLRAIQEAHVLVHTSEMEGGAHVIMEAVCSGTPVIASHVAGNIGMLGPEYEGYFPHGDANALARLLAERPPSPLLARLRRQCDMRAPLFAPGAERQAVRALVRDLEEPE